jgi:hypothetical protein
MVTISYFQIKSKSKVVIWEEYTPLLIRLSGLSPIQFISGRISAAVRGRWVYGICFRLGQGSRKSRLIL